MTVELNRAPTARDWTHEALVGARDTAPILPGVLPFGMIYGAAAVAAGLSPTLAQGMSVALFAGASQVAAVDLLVRDAGWLTILVAILVINSRFVMYGAALAPSLPRLSGPRGILASYILTDQSFAVTLARSRQDPDPERRLSYFLGSSVTLWCTWQLGTLGGILVGAVIPPSWQLEFSIPLMFLALLFPVLRDRPSWLAAAVAGMVVIAAKGLPHNLGLIVGVIAGIATGLLAERRFGTGEDAS
ncbi:MAG: AzlC family ABC transporter permease [bacterium]|nr:AzlC family ABC transporter permease [bacterium]